MSSPDELAALDDDQTDWSNIFRDGKFSLALMEAAQAADTARMQEMLQERRLARAQGRLAQPWRPPTVPSEGYPALSPTDIPVVPWLDPKTMYSIQTLVVKLVTTHSVICAVLLFGSIARHDEKPLDDTDPSDVDLLILYEAPVPHHLSTGQSSSRLQELEIESSISGTASAHLYVHPSPRECDLHIVPVTLHNESPLFIAGVVEDAVPLWCHDPWPHMMDRLLNAAGRPHPESTQGLP